MSKRQSTASLKRTARGVVVKALYQMDCNVITIKKSAYMSGQDRLYKKAGAIVEEGESCVLREPGLSLLRQGHHQCAVQVPPCQCHLPAMALSAEVGTPSRATHGFINDDSVVFTLNKSDEVFFSMFTPAGNACPQGFVTLIPGHG